LDNSQNHLRCRKSHKTRHWSRPEVTGEYISIGIKPLLFLSRGTILAALGLGFAPFTSAYIYHHVAAFCCKIYGCRIVYLPDCKFLSG